jgi:U3 small nucleolar RNA-associated protein 7
MTKDSNHPSFESKVHKYTRGKLNNDTKTVKYKHLRHSLEKTNAQIKDAAISAAEAEVLLPTQSGFIDLENKNEKIFKLKQNEIKKNVDLNSAKNALDLQLNVFGPYNIDYTRNGRHLLFAGKKGHVAILDCVKLKVGMELQLKEEVYDVHYLHNETMFAVAQNKFTYIYDHKGIEIHCMKKHERPFKLDFLPYHFLLTSVGHSGWIKWHDISIGQYVAGFNTGHGPCKVLKHNPVNAVSHLGHSNGVVSLWSPASNKALISIFCHRSPITDIAIDREGFYMATAGLDGFMKVYCS